MKFSASASASSLAVFAVAALIGCTTAPDDSLDSKSSSAATGTAATPFAGAWEFEGHCTSKGARAACSAFARINAIPKAMHFYDDGRKAAILYLGFGETDPDANVDVGDVKESDPLTWGSFAASPDGRLVIGTTSTEIPYRVQLVGSALAYCFDSEKACAMLVKRGVAAKGLGDRLARYEAHLTSTKRGDVSYACEDKNGTCTEYIFASALTYFPFDRKRCGDSDRELRTCKVTKTGCRTTLLGVTFISWFGDEVEPGESCDRV